MAQNQHLQYTEEQSYPPQPQPRTNQRPPPPQFARGEQSYGYQDQPYGRSGSWNQYDEQDNWQAGQNGYHEQWEGEQYQAPTGRRPNGSANGGPRERMPREGRRYQYDERYQQDGRRMGNSRRQDEVGPVPRERRRPQMEHQTPRKPRERILQDEPRSPDLVSWDNPFPSFGPKKRPEKKKNSSVDKDFEDLTLQGNKSPSSRPHTSDGNQRLRVETRPHTSHESRPTERQQFQSPPLPNQNSMPLRKDPPNRYDSTFAQQGDQSGRPAPTPLLPNVHTEPSRSFQNEPAPSFAQPPPRSNTMPDMTNHVPRQNLPNPSFREPRQSEPEGFQGYHHVQSDNRVNDGQVRDQYKGSHDGRSPTLPTFADELPPAQSRSQAGQQRFYDDAQRAPPPRMQPEMPNFDAVSSPTYDKSPDYLPPPRAEVVTKPAYQKPTYQALQETLPQLNTRPQVSNPGRPNHAGNSPLAEFQFNLQDVQSPRAEITSPPGQNRPYNGGQYARENDTSYDYSTQPPNPGFQPYQGNRRPPNYFPPRGPSQDRPQQFRSASDSRGHPYQNQYQNQSRSTSDAVRRPPQNPNKPYNYDQGYADGPEYDDYGQPPQPNRGNQPVRNGNEPPYYPENGNRMGPGPPQDRFQSSNYENGRGQPRMAGPIRPPPIRQYDQQGAAGPAQAQPDRQVGLQSPDSLPAHPVPVRPGLLKQSAEAQRSSRDGYEQQSQAVSKEAGGTQSKEAGRKSPPITAYDLNLLQQTVRANPSDHATALKFAKKLVEAATVLASDGGKADAKTTATNRERYILDAHKMVKKLISAGYPPAMFYLADCYGQGLLGLEPDPKEAFNLYQSAAKAGHAPSAYRTAVCCEMGAEEGGGTRRDPMKAMQWYKRAASLGDVPAMYKMGMILLKGLLGQPRNPREALSWLKRAAERADEENPHALHELGLLYESAAPNDSIIRDEKYARQLFLQAAELGYKYSQFRLGSAYEYGMLGCPIDARQSIAWYSRAAAQGEHQSELALSGWYLTGAEGILQQSDTEAYLWARKAASSGLAKAEYAMGYFIEVGIGTAANLDEAKRWYWRAASQNFPKARERLDDLKKGGGKMHKTRVSRSAISKQKEGDCIVM